MERNPNAQRVDLRAEDHHSALSSGEAHAIDARQTPPRELHEKKPFSSIRRIRTLTKRLENGADGELLEALQAEILLLREENAQLRIKLERAPELGDVVEQMRAMTARGPTQKDGGDHAWHLLTEALMTRDALIDLCQRTREAMASLEGRLQELEPLGMAGSREAANGAEDHLNGNGNLLAGAAGVVPSNGSAASPVEAVAQRWPLVMNPSPHPSNGHVTEDR